MVCCVALGMVVALVARCWRWLTWQPPRQAELFAPVARRRAGEEPDAAVSGGVQAAADKQTTRLVQHRWGVALFWLGVVATLLAAADAWVWHGLAMHVPAPVGCGFEVANGSWVSDALHLAFHSGGLLIAWAGWILIRRAAADVAPPTDTYGMTYIGQQ